MGSVDKRPRVQIRLTEDQMMQVKYWAARDQVSVNEWVEDAIQQVIGIRNGNYQLPTLEQHRLNQLIDVVTVLSSNVNSLENVVISGLDSLLNLTRGDNYLLEEEDGEL